MKRSKVIASASHPDLPGAVTLDQFEVLAWV